ncbi:MAG: hypothetical protein QM756_31365 [Polyangiaceae bacterium]
MIYEWLYPLSQHHEWARAFNVLRYTPFRAIMATITAMLMSFLVAPWFIKKLRGKQIGRNHSAKKGRPRISPSAALRPWAAR